MKKKIIILISAFFIILIVYLFAAHHYIYKEIGSAGFKPSDTQGEYIVGSNTDSRTGLIYTALGDSLTAGVGVSKYEESYPYRLAQKLSVNGRNILLRDRSYPGIRTSGLFGDLLTATVKDQPDIITLLIGVNDIHGNVSKATFAANYEKILKQLKAGTKAKIFAISIPFIGTDALLLPPYRSYFKYETVEYNKIIKQLAQAENVGYIDLYTPTERMFENAALASSDLFHPSAEGYGLWADIIYANFNK